jgi:osmotically-inducible protein OsmY
LRRYFFLFALAAGLMIIASPLACRRSQTPSVRAQVEKALSSAGFRHIDIDEDQTKSVITLNGRVRSPEEKQRAEQLAQAAAAGHVIANQLSIEPPGAERKARKIEADVDTAIEKLYNAALIANGLDRLQINARSKNGTLTLDGEVDTIEQRTLAEQIAAKVPNVDEVVNKLQVKKQVTSTHAESTGSD